MCGAHGWRLAEPPGGSGLEARAGRGAPGKARVEARARGAGLREPQVEAGACHALRGPSNLSKGGMRC